MRHPSYHGPGSRAEDLQLGDFILVHDSGICFPQLIRVGQRLRFPKEDAYWNHAAFCVWDGMLVEAKGGHRARKVELAQYDPIEYLAVPVHCADELQRLNAATFALSQVGAPYGYLTIASLAVWTLTGGKFTVGFSGSDICSGLVARATERMGAIYDRSPECIMPADLAASHRVQTSGW